MDLNIDRGGLAALAAGIGATLGLTQLLASDDKITLKLAFVRAISNAGLAVGSFSLLTIFPGLPDLALVGLACAVSSLGTSGLERIFQRILGGTTNV